MTNEKVIGHLFLSPAWIETECGRHQGAGLGPVAIVPTHQGRLIGTRQIEEGLRRLKEKGCPWIVVIGHSGYYPGFGFAPSGRYGLRYESEVPEEAFMVLVPAWYHKLPGHGIVNFHPAFGRV